MKHAQKKYILLLLLSNNIPQHLYSSYDNKFLRVGKKMAESTFNATSKIAKGGLAVARFAIDITKYPALISIGYNYYKIDHKDIADVKEKYFDSLKNEFTQNQPLLENITSLKNDALDKISEKEKIKFVNSDFGKIYYQTGKLLVNTLEANLLDFIRNKEITINKDGSTQFDNNNINTINIKKDLKMYLAGILSNTMLKKSLLSKSDSNINLELLLNEKANEFMKSDVIEALKSMENFDIDQKFINGVIKETMEDLTDFQNIQILYSYYLYNGSDGSAFTKKTNLPKIIKKDGKRIFTINISNYSGFNPFKSPKDLNDLEIICNGIIKQNEQKLNTLTSEEKIAFEFAQNALKNIEQSKINMRKRSDSQGLFSYAKRKLEAIENFFTYHWNSDKKDFLDLIKFKEKQSSRPDTTVEKKIGTKFAKKAAAEYRDASLLFKDTLQNILSLNVFLGLGGTIWGLKKLYDYYTELMEGVELGQSKLDKMKHFLKIHEYTPDIKQKINAHLEKITIKLLELNEKIAIIKNDNTGWIKKTSLRMGLISEAKKINSLFKETKKLIKIHALPKIESTKK